MINIRNDAFLIALGKHIRSLRQQQNWSQEDLAYKSDLALSQIGRIERGEINPTICTLKVLAEVLESDLPGLFMFIDPVEQFDD